MTRQQILTFIASVIYYVGLLIMCAIVIGAAALIWWWLWTFISRLLGGDTSPLYVVGTIAVIALFGYGAMYLFEWAREMLKYK